MGLRDRIRKRRNQPERKERRQRRWDRIAHLLGVVGGQMLGTRKIGAVLVVLIAISGVILIVRFVL